MVTNPCCGPRRSRPDGSDKGSGGHRRNAKIVLEWLFYLGTVTTATRRGFERLYDLTERVLPDEAGDVPERVLPAGTAAERDRPSADILFFEVVVDAAGVHVPVDGDD